MGLRSEIVYRLARQRVLSQTSDDVGGNEAAFDGDAYDGWRRAELHSQMFDHFDRSLIDGKDVFDFGCGEGPLAIMLAEECNAKSIVGTDVDAPRIESARERARTLKTDVIPRFEVATVYDKIELPTDSVDTLLAFDVLEHVLDYEPIFHDWTRVLRPGGRVAIWWMPWLHPYGHHIQSLVPLPWVHAVFPDRVLIDVCRRIYDMDEFEPRIWDLDDDGNKKPNKWAAMSELPDVNKLTIAEFERICSRIGLRVVRRKQYGFGSSGIKKLTHNLTRLPMINEYFTSYVIYELENEP